MWRRGSAVFLIFHLTSVGSGVNRKAHRRSLIGGGARPKPPKGMVVLSRMKARMECASGSDCRQDTCRGRDKEVGMMCPQGTCKGLRRVAQSARTSVSLFSSISGVVMGGPHVTGGRRGFHSSLLRSEAMRIDVFSLGVLPVSGRDRIVTGKSPSPASRLRNAHNFNRSAGSERGRLNIRLYHESVYVREVPLRRTKQRRRFNPGRCRDYDLRFSFPQCSQRLPFFSQDARVEMGRSAMKG